MNDLKTLISRTALAAVAVGIVGVQYVKAQGSTSASGPGPVTTVEWDGVGNDTYSSDGEIYGTCYDANYNYTWGCISESTTCWVLVDCYSWDGNDGDLGWPFFVPGYMTDNGFSQLNNHSGIPGPGDPEQPSFCGFAYSNGDGGYYGTCCIDDNGYNCWE